MTTPATTFTVTNTSDSLAGSSDKRYCPPIQALVPTLSTLPFPERALRRSLLLSAAAISALTIDGTTQSPGSASPPIELTGNDAEVGGLSVSGGNSILRGLVINGFNSAGIVLSGSGHIIEGDYIGTSAAGGAGLGNDDSGVVINSNTSAHLIGGTTAAARNVISGNLGHGVLVLGASMNNLIQGNFIGVDAAGTIGLGNFSDGVEMLSGINNVINCFVGGTTPGAGNVISANAGVGVQFITVGTSNLVQGNLIGTNVTGSIDLGNGSSGVAMNEANECTVGGTVAGAGNVISGNGADGVRINAATATGNLVQGNRIGTRTDGVTPLPNGSQGVRVLNSASNNTIGGASGEGNVIAGNLAGGVLIESGTGNAIRSNSIFSNGGLGIDLAPAASLRTTRAMVTRVQTICRTFQS
jgi:hypothetical protein